MTLVFNIFWMNMAAIFALANIVLIALLLGLYYQSWRKIHSRFTASLCIFAVFFLIQSTVVVVFWFTLYSYAPDAQKLVLTAAPYLVLITGLETIGLGNIVRITWN
jgi:predicted ferric reductase